MCHELLSLVQNIVEQTSVTEDKSEKTLCLLANKKSTLLDFLFYLLKKRYKSGFIIDNQIVVCPNVESIEIVVVMWMLDYTVQS